jgi:NitT/TauT family transport system substrate-binding protein
MDDYPIWAAKELGYFDEQNIDVEMQPGPLEALAVTKLVAEGQADVGFPSPGVLLSSIDAGMPLIMGWGMITGQTFDFALPADSPITSVQELEGKTIALGSEGWSVIVDPILVEAGVDPETVTYVNAGNQWGQAAALGQADAALAWRGLQAQWTAQGLDLKFLIGMTFSKHPSNGYCIRKEDLNDAAQVDIWQRFFRGLCQGFEFSFNNPRAGAQITYNQFPALQEKMPPQLALDSMLELAVLYYDNRRRGLPYGQQDMAAWQSYIDTVFELGQIQTQYKAEDVISNALVEEANNFDMERVKADAKAYEVSAEFQDLEINYDIGSPS